MLNTKLSMDSVNFINFVLEFQPEPDLLVECLISLLEVFLDNSLLIHQVLIVFFKLFDLFVNFDIPLFIQILTGVDDLLPLLYFGLHGLNLPELIPFNFANHSFELSPGAVLQ